MCVCVCIYVERDNLSIKSSKPHLDLMLEILKFQGKENV